MEQILKFIWCNEIYYHRSFPWVIINRFILQNELLLQTLQSRAVNSDFIHQEVLRQYFK